MNPTRLAPLVLIAVLSAVVPPSALGASTSEGERFRATAASAGGLMVGGRSAPSGFTTVDITVDRLSTAAEREALLGVLAEGGRGDLAQALEDSDPVGRVIVRGRTGVDLRYAREIPLEDGGRLLILATDRRLQFGEIARNTRSSDYDISLIQLVLDGEGNGSGTAMPAVEVSYDEAAREIAITNLSTAPVQLTRVKKVD